jgi:GrpB-like predicted nucleotidyltransferase (UPF0157 family)
VIQVVSYDASWPRRFEEEAAAIGATFGPLARRIEHVGSTAVPGLDAKPVIDIQVSVPSLASLERFVPLMTSLGYVHLADPDPEFERRYPFFHKPAQWPHSHHVHLCEAESDMEWRHVAFRDYLRTHADAHIEYVALKRELAARHGGSTHEERQGYADAKTEFIERILAAVATRK